VGEFITFLDYDVKIGWVMCSADEIVKTVGLAHRCAVRADTGHSTGRRLGAGTGSA
jgi:hypothetical protein